MVVDSEGLFYRPHGASIIPWRDIRNVERIEETHGATWEEDPENGSYHILVTTRDSLHLIVIKIDYLPGYPIFTASGRLGNAMAARRSAAWPASGNLFRVLAHYVSQVRFARLPL